MGMKTCGSCKFGVAIPNDLTMVECHGFCRQLVVVPQPGGFAIQGQYPNQMRTDAACCAYEPKLVLTDATISE